MITVRANAKINLYLDILGRLENGFHSLCMVMQSVDLADTLTLRKTRDGGIRLNCSEPDLPRDARNLAWKSAQSFFLHTGVQNPGIEIYIEKRIPFAAGLAGGSADAAAVLAGLNRLFHTDMDTSTLRRIGLCVGSDVPFCLVGGTMLAQNMGDILSTLPPLASCYVLLVKPFEGVSTAEAYAAYDRAQSIRHPDTAGMLACAAAGDFAGICRHAANVFEQVTPLPILAKVRDVLRQSGASLAQMSGSGPTVFGLFAHEGQAKQAQKHLSDFAVETFFCAPAPSGLVLTEDL